MEFIERHLAVDARDGIDETVETGRIAAAEHDETAIARTHDRGDRCPGEPRPARMTENAGLQPGQFGGAENVVWACRLQKSKFT